MACSVHTSIAESHATRNFPRAALTLSHSSRLVDRFLSRRVKRYHSDVCFECFALVIRVPGPAAKMKWQSFDESHQVRPMCDDAAAFSKETSMQQQMTVWQQKSVGDTAAAAVPVKIQPRLHLVCEERCNNSPSPDHGPCVTSSPSTPQNAPSPQPRVATASPTTDRHASLPFPYRRFTCRADQGQNLTTKIGALTNPSPRSSLVIQQTLLFSALSNDRPSMRPLLPRCMSALVRLLALLPRIALASLHMHHLSPEQFAPRHISLPTQNAHLSRSRVSC